MSAISLLPTKSTILITGGATGIGLEFAKQLTAGGHKVIVTGRRQEKLDQAKALIPSLEVLQGDVSTEDGRETMVQQVVSRYPDVNVLINNAAVMFPTASEVTERSQWQAIKDLFNTNIDGTMHMSYLFVPYFKQKPSLIVNISSLVAFVPLADSLAYTISKAAIHHFTVGLRLQLRNTPIKVVEAIPGPTITELLPEKYYPGAVTAEFYVKDALSKIEAGQVEFGCTGGPSESVSRAPREVHDILTNNFNGVEN